MTEAHSFQFCCNSKLLTTALAAALVSTASFSLAQTAPKSPVDIAPLPAAKPAAPAATPPATTSAADRATAYYHAALADNYEDMATNYGRQEFATRAVEEYKLALNEIGRASCRDECW